MYRIDERIHRVDTMYIENVTKASKGAGNQGGKSKGKGKGRARENVQPRGWYDMTGREQS